MRDRREEILARLLVILGTGSLSLGSTWRNRGNLDALPSDQYPAGVTLDGDEERHSEPYGVIKPDMPFTLFTLLPQIFIVPEPTKTVTNEGIGPLMSGLRIKVIDLFTSDQIIKSILGEDGQIEYLRCSTDMKTGHPMRGGMQFDFAYTYLLDPEELR